MFASRSFVRISRLLPVFALAVAAALPCRAAIQQSEPQAGSQDAPAQDAQVEVELPGRPGPMLGELGEYAAIDVPEGFRYLGPDEARALLESFGNPASQRELGLVLDPTGEWFVVFEYSDTGHVKDDEKEDLDADVLLESMREGNEQGNEIRKQRGWDTIELVGWAQEPHYDAATNNLEWALRARSTNGESINHNTRLLGRTGVMETTLVCDAGSFEQVLPAYKTFLRGFDYKKGHRYAEYVAGDKLATYGLTALVAGGAGVLAAKSGLLGKLWKVLVAGLIAVGALVKKLFGRKAEKAAGS